MTSAEPIAAGQRYVQASAAPGFAPVSYTVLGPAPRDGWWWCRSSINTERRIPGKALQNPGVYRLVT